MGIDLLHMRCAKTRAHICITLVGLARVDCYGIYFILIKLSFDMSAHRASARPHYALHSNSNACTCSLMKLKPKCESQMFMVYNETVE